MKKLLIRYKIELLSFIIPIIVFAIACLFAKVWPFGNNYIAAYDGSAQYPGFTTYLINVLKGNDSLFYSFKGALGFNFYATAIYYLFNPTNLLSIFFNKENIMVFYTLIVFLRIGLSGLTMSIYLKYKDKNSKARLLFSIAYALMAYNVLYFYNFMYFDTIVLFPLVILGLDKLIEGKSSKTYIIFLTLSIISNFYIGAMVCIFSLLYFIYRFILLSKEKRNKKLISKFIISSLLSGIMCAFIILPVFFELMSGKASLYGSKYTIYNKWGLDFFASFYRLSIASYSQGEQSNGYPNIYCSLLVVVYTVLFFFNKKFSKKEKITTGIFIAFFLLCFSYNLLDYAWQFFQKPVWYPNRYSFVFSFLLIITAYKCFNNSDKIKISNLMNIIITLSLIALVVNAAIYCEIFSEDASKIIFLVLSCICIIEYFLTCKMKIMPIILSTIFIFEMGANTLVSVKQINYAKKVNEYTESFDGLNQAFEYIETIDPDINNFYRSDSDAWTNINNGGTFNYNGMIYFNSLRNGKMMYFLEHYARYSMQDECSARFNANNPLFTSLFGFKYIVAEDSVNYYQLINSELKNKVYRNNEALSIGMMMNSKIKDIKLEVDKPYINTSNIMNYALANNEKYISTISYSEVVRYWEGTEEGKKYVYYNSADGGYVSFKGVADKDYFILIDTPISKNGMINLVLNEKELLSITSKSFTPNELVKGDEYEFKFYFNVNKILSSDLKIYLLDKDAYLSWIDEINNNELNIIEYKKDNYIKGSINVTSDKTTLFTSIPYDKGWKVLVDGKKVKYDNILSAFIGVDLTEGEHIIEFKYVPRGLIIGLIISIISLITSIVYIKKTY